MLREPGSGKPQGDGGGVETEPVTSFHIPLASDIFLSGYHEMKTWSSCEERAVFPAQGCPLMPRGWKLVLYWRTTALFLKSWLSWPTSHTSPVGGMGVGWKMSSGICGGWGDIVYPTCVFLISSHFHSSIGCRVSEAG